MRGSSQFEIETLEIRIEILIDKTIHFESVGRNQTVEDVEVFFPYDRERRKTWKGHIIEPRAAKAKGAAELAFYV